MGKKILYSTASETSSAAAMEMAQQSHDIMVAGAGLVHARLTPFFLGLSFAEDPPFCLPKILYCSVNTGTQESLRVPPPASILFQSSGACTTNKS